MTYTGATMSGLLLVAIVSSFRTGFAQTTHTVRVGAEGSFYDPPTISAAINDTVTFVFNGAQHSVVQGTWENPCVPVPGGFSSGLIKGSNGTSPAPLWSLKITNVTFGIWFYCGNNVPLNHCSSGMVGAINPPSQDTYDEYLAAAKLFTGTAPPITVALTGQSAFATTPPRAPEVVTQTTATLSSSALITSSSSTFPSPTSTPSPTQTAASTKRKNGGTIAGSVVGGLAFLVLLGFLSIYLRRRRKRLRRGSLDFFRYRAQTPTFGRGRTDFNPSMLVSSPEDRAKDRLIRSASSTPASIRSTLPPSAQPHGVHPYSTATPRVSEVHPYPPTFTKSSTDTSPPPPPPPLPSMPAIPPPLVDHKPPLSSKTTTTTTTTEENIRELAREVAAVLSQTHLQPLRRPSSRIVGSGGGTERGESPAPPEYLASTT